MAAAAVLMAGMRRMAVDGSEGGDAGHDGLREGGRLQEAAQSKDGAARVQDRLSRRDNAPSRAQRWWQAMQAAFELAIICGPGLPRPAPGPLKAATLSGAWAMRRCSSAANGQVAKSADRVAFA